MDYGLDGWGIRVWFPTGARNFHVFNSVKTTSGHSPLDNTPLLCFILSHLQLNAHRKSCQSPPKSLTLERVTAGLTERLVSLQHYLWCVVESWSYTLGSSRKNIGWEYFLDAWRRLGYRKLVPKPYSIQTLNITGETEVIHENLEIRATHLQNTGLVLLLCQSAQFCNLSSCRISEMYIQWNFFLLKTSLKFCMCD
jgi:hypothetical protein